MFVLLRMQFHNHVDTRQVKRFVRAMRCQIWNVASAKEKYFAAQILWWFCAVALLTGNTGHQGVRAIW